MDTEAGGGKRSNELGAWGRQAAANIADLRERAGMNQEMLAARVRDQGRPMTALIVSRSEAGDRRIDVDDLAAFAIALGVTPNRLLLSGTADAGEATEGKVFEHPELLRAIRRTATLARKLGVPLTELTLASSYEYMTGGA